MLVWYTSLLFLFCSLLSNSNGQDNCYFEKCYDDKTKKALPCITQGGTISLERNVTVTNTCGEKEREKYCYLAVNGKCDYCDANSSSENHPARYLVDSNDETWWQSQSWQDTNKAGLTTTKSPLKVNITLSFGKSFLISGHVQVKFQSDRPKAMIIEKSIDNGHTWEIMQYYAKRCDDFYKMSTENSVDTADPFKVQCTDKYSRQYPRAGGLVKYKATDRYTLCSFFDTKTQKGLLATNVRVRLEYPATDGLESHSVSSMNKYYYSISDIEVTGQCFCNGHARFCTGTRMNTVCKCQHDTMGKDCELCKPLFNNRPWMTANRTHANECQECHCNNRGTSCKYNATLGYGLCTGCRNNSEGDHCEKCVDKYYRDLSKPLNHTEACTACDCFPDGIINDGSCLQNATSTQEIGQCSCKPKVFGRRCDQCKPGHWGFTLPPRGECQTCNCSILGTGGGSIECNQLTGQCNCKPSIEGQYCNKCKHEYYRYPRTQGEGCRRCPCDLGGAYPGCHKDTGACTCRRGIENQRCTSVSSHTFVPMVNFNMIEAESTKVPVELRTPAVAGLGTEFTGYGYASLMPHSKILFENITVNISHNYSVVVRYTAAGQCTHGQVMLNMTGPNLMKEETIPGSMLQIGRGKAGILSDLVHMADDEYYSVMLGFNGSSGCKLWIDSLLFVPDVNTTRMYTMSSQLHKDTLQHCIVSQSALSTVDTAPANCSSLLFSAFAQIYNGSLECDCNPHGSINSSYCMAYGGQCQCKPGVSGRTCDHCMNGYYGFSSSGCTKCSCNVAGSLSSVCDAKTGACKCKDDVTGANCDQCKANYFNLDANYKQGCQACFAYGHATSCTSACGFVENVINSNFDSNSSDPLLGWKTTDAFGNIVNVNESWNDGVIVPASVSVTYLSAPMRFLGNKLWSYKQKLEIDMSIDSTSPNSSITDFPGIILKGREVNFTLPLLPTPSKNITKYYIILDEHHVTSPTKITSFDFQSVLTEVSSLLVPATFYTHPHGHVTFRNISLTHAVKKNDVCVSGQVTFVENATCHGNYTGLSCERCAPGYKREIPNSNPFGKCVLCSCNGRSSECDAQSGNCTNCQVGTLGDKCQYCENNVMEPNCTECKASFWGLSRSGCKGCGCHTPGTLYSNSTVCDKVTGQCACNAAMNVGGRRCDKCKENSYNASVGISDCRECSSCYAFLQNDVHRLRPQVAQLTDLSIQYQRHPVMQHQKTFITRLREIVHKVRELMMKVSDAAANDSSFKVKWEELERQVVVLETKVNVNLSSAVNASSEISAHVQANHETINKTISQISKMLNDGYHLLVTSIEQRVNVVENYLTIMNSTDLELSTLQIESQRLLNLTLYYNSSIHSGIRYSVSRANQAGVHAQTVQKSHDQFSATLHPLRMNCTATKSLGEQAKKMAEHRLTNATSVLNETRVLYRQASVANPDNSKTIESLNAHSTKVATSSANYANQSMHVWSSSISVTDQVYASIKHARELLMTCNIIEQNVTEQRTSAELAHQIAMNATELANKIHKEALRKRDILKNFKSVSEEAASRANESLAKAGRIEIGLNEVLTNATSVNASIHDAVVESKRAVDLAMQAKKRAEQELEALDKALKRAERLKNETAAQEEVIANQTVREYIRTEIEPVEALCQNVSTAAEKISTKASEALRQANETDTKSRQIIAKIHQASNDSTSLALSSSGNSLQALEREVARVRQRFVSLNLEPSINQLRAKLLEHKGKYKEYKAKKDNLRAQINEFKRIMLTFKDMSCSFPIPP